MTTRTPTLAFQARAEGANVLLGIFTAISLWIGARARRSKRFWWMGIALGITAVFNFLLLILPAYEWVWLVGQLVWVTLFYLARQTEIEGWQAFPLLGVVLFIAVLILSIVLIWGFPYPIHANLPNPLALSPAVAWMWVMGSTLQNGRWQLSRLDHWLMLGLVVYTSTQLFLVSQANLQHPTLLTASHLGFALGHATLLIGLAIQLRTMFERAKQTEEELRQANAKLKQEIEGKEELQKRSQLSLKRRTDEVDTVTAVAQEIATAPILQELFQRVVTLVQNRFDYYHAQVYTLNENILTMQEGTGETGARLKAKEHKIPISATKSLVVQAVLRERPILVPDVTQSTLWLSNPLLPETKAELAVPIQLRDQILGVLDVQSNQVNGLNEEDQLLLMGLCGQIAVAIHSQNLREQQRIAENELQRYAEELERSNRELEDFAHIASHDLQEPLRMIASYLQLLERCYSNQLDKDGKEFIHHAVNGAQRMQQLIEDLLTYSRVGTRGNIVQSVDCEQVLDITLNNLQIAMMEAEASIIRDPLPRINGDTSQFIMLFQNLIGNAIKFHGKAPPVIHVRAQDEGTHWHFAIKDNGIGIEEKNLERIFVIFQRLHNRKKYPGTGIGLTICKKIVERHSGKIGVESEVGAGTTFWFTIPKQTQIGNLTEQTV